MQIGEVSAVVNDQLIDCWNWNANRTELLKGCVLEIEPVKAVTYCEDCKKEYETVKYGKNLPVLQKAKGLIFLRGNEVMIKRNRRGIIGENQKTIGCFPDGFSLCFYSSFSFSCSSKKTRRCVSSRCAGFFSVINAVKEVYGVQRHEKAL
ncbi:MAG: hydrogenase maturation nickel metallochaperone HypA [Clostridiales bacterium]|nr:MAG: hydrogenase maturation nickel metallochaperone HypA [Clostridiales bacterium]